MKIINSENSSSGSVDVGSLLAGDYLLRVNASYGGSDSYTSDYFGIQQIESANFSMGTLRISIGSPSIDQVSLTQNYPSGPSGTSFIGLEDWPLILSSPDVVRNVNLTSISIIQGDWVKFVPSQLSEVGPNGTSVEMLLAGGVRPFSHGDGINVSMIIQAQGSGGVLGEVALPLTGTGSSIVVHSLQLQGQEFSVGPWTALATNQTNYGIYSLTYDPSSEAGNQSLPLSISIAGFFNDSGQIGPQPAGLQFFVPDSSESLSIAPDQPLYFMLGFNTTNAAPPGSYSLVVNLTIGDETITVFTPIVVKPAITVG